MTLTNGSQGTLQFVIIKPVLSLLSLILFTFGVLDIGDPRPFNGWIYIALVSDGLSESGSLGIADIYKMNVILMMVKVHLVFTSTHAGLERDLLPSALLPVAVLPWHERAPCSG